MKLITLQNQELIIHKDGSNREKWKTLDYKFESENGFVALTGRGVTPISTKAWEEDEKKSGRVYTEKGENNLIVVKLEYNKGTRPMTFFAVPETRSRKENTDLYYPIIYRTHHRLPPIDGLRTVPNWGSKIFVGSGTQHALHLSTLISNPDLAFPIDNDKS